MIKEKLDDFLAGIYVSIFMWSATKVFPVVVEWRETPTSDFTVIHCAWAQRDLNCAVRDYVEELDNDIKSNTN